MLNKLKFSTVAVAIYAAQAALAVPSFLCESPDKGSYILSVDTSVQPAVLAANRVALEGNENEPRFFSLVCNPEASDAQGNAVLNCFKKTDNKPGIGFSLVDNAATFEISRIIPAGMVRIVMPTPNVLCGPGGCCGSGRPKSRTELVPVNKFEMTKYTCTPIQYEQLN